MHCYDMTSMFAPAHTARRSSALGGFLFSVLASIWPALEVRHTLHQLLNAYYLDFLCDTPTSTRLATSIGLHLASIEMRSYGSLDYFLQSDELGASKIGGGGNWRRQIRMRVCTLPAVQAPQTEVLSLQMCSTLR